MRALILALVLIATLTTAGRAADDPAEAACSTKTNTLDIVTCLQQATAQWDKRLNTAYEAVRKASENAARKTSLLKAERDWLTYRAANCGWYAAQDGTIRETDAATCMLEMTRARARELQRSLQ